MKNPSDRSDLEAEGLTKEQAAAAADDLPAILCIACAGSGKSQTRAYRIARLLPQGVPAASIVAITYKAADSPSSASTRATDSRPSCASSSELRRKATT